MDWAARFIKRIHEARPYVPINAPLSVVQPIGKKMIEVLAQRCECTYVLDEVHDTVTFLEKGKS